MPYIESRQFERLDEMERLQKKKKNRVENEYINSQMKSEKKPTTDQMIQYMNQVARKQPLDEEQKPPSAKEILQQLELTKTIKEQQNEELEKMLQNDEMKDMKNAIIGIMAHAHKDDTKRIIFYNKLKKSEIINEWINNNLFLKFFGRTGKNIQFALVYGLNYLGTNDEYKNLILQQMALKQRMTMMKQQETSKEEVKEEVKEEKPDIEIEKVKENE